MGVRTLGVLVQLSETGYDPIQRVIDWQLRTHWPDVFLYESHLKKKISLNTTEDNLIFALDAKYHHVYRRDYWIFLYLSDGFTQEEVGKMLGLSRRHVIRLVQKSHTNVTF